MNRKLYLSLFLGLTTLIALRPDAARAASSSPFQRWTTVGPDGGDARAFAFSSADPHRIYLGTTNSWIYESADNGSTWMRLAELGNVDDLVVDNLVVDEADPKTIYAGVWQLDRPGGGIYISHDGGVTWVSTADMDGKSIRSLAQAPSNPKILIAGAIGGVFQSDDGGQHWKKISPEGSGEIHKVESIAIDPTDPKTIYAGTWHLPWKTTDGGATWNNITKGLIDDSDVFSIILDSKTPATVYLSACSGIYKSETGGQLFHKIQGIPSTARRTRVLEQDPVNRDIVYAGTTEGLYKTTDAGVNWSRMTGPDVIINDVHIDPTNPQDVLLATDRSGVLLSKDGGASFISSNDGISQRQVTALLADAKSAETMYAGVVNDKSYGGVFVTENGGKDWEQRSEGLEGRDVFSLAQSDAGVVYAGTSHGLFKWNGHSWDSDGKVVNTKEKTRYVWVHHKKVAKTTTETLPATTIDSQVNDLSVNGGVWFVATADGVYRSDTQGANWTGPVLTAPHYRFVDSHGEIVFAAQRDSLWLSIDNGLTWTALPLPTGLTSVRALTTTPAGELWVGGREGAFYSNDSGRTWTRLALPVNDIHNIDYDPGLKRVVITSNDSDLVFAIDLNSKTWKWWDAGWRVRMVHSMNGRLVGASLYDGIVVQPEQGGSDSQEKAQR
jgi:photosystem II stability/assembly factor-like uncharacterized protein